jgi:integrase
LEVIRKIEARGAIEMAKRVKNLCSEIFQYAIAEGECRRGPAADIRRAINKPCLKQQRAALLLSEFPAFLMQLKNYYGDEVTKLVFRFTLLTMMHTQEARIAKWTEFEQFDRSEPLWRLSLHRMKMSREHLVPLSRQAMSIL